MLVKLTPSKKTVKQKDSCSLSPSPTLEPNSIFISKTYIPKYAPPLFPSYRHLKRFLFTRQRLEWTLPALVSLLWLFLYLALTTLGSNAWNDIFRFFKFNFPSNLEIILKVCQTYSNHFWTYSWPIRLIIIKWININFVVNFVCESINFNFAKLKGLIVMANRSRSV